MEKQLLAKAFGVWQGYAYEYQGSLSEQQDPASWITGKISVVLENNDFISSVAEIKGRYYVYVKSPLPPNEDFFEIGDLAPVYVEPVDLELNPSDEESQGE